MSNTNQSVSTDQALQVAVDTKRRAVLRYLHENPETTVSMPVLVSELSVPAADPKRAVYADPDHAKADLYHRVLPPLEDANVIDYDQTTDAVCYHAPEPVEKLLDFISDELE